MTQDERDATLTAAVAEYQFVSGLIPFYRTLEMTVLAGTGLVLSGIVAAITAIETSDNPQRSAEGILLVSAAWVPALLLLIEDVALTRLARASAYIAQCLQPLVETLTGNGLVMGWERSPTTPLLDRLGLKKDRFGSRIVGLMATSTPFIVMICLASVVLATIGMLIQPRWWSRSLGGGAIVFAALAASYGIWFTSTHEGR
ncbi:MAG: hypothetical protein LC799_07205 [Actinobacteria bacterium]|nr:hypothetical protein [Actinomycetota bacterium]